MSKAPVITPCMAGSALQDPFMEYASVTTVADGEIHYGNA